MNILNNLQLWIDVAIIFISTNIFCYLIKKYAYQLKLIDTPNQRSSHSNITPKGGGFGLLFSFIILSFIHHFNPIFSFSVVFLSLLSFWGDRHDISPKLRILNQFAVAFIILWNLNRENNLFSFFSSPYLQALFAFFLIIYLVGTLNFYNFMDGINGISAITSIVFGFLLIGFQVYILGELNLMSLPLLLIVGGGAFLPWNIPNAKLFLGDVGSILLGLLIPYLVLKNGTKLIYLIALFNCILPYYIDEITSIISRLKNKQSLFSPHRSHLYQLLANELKIPHWKISLSYGFFQFIIGAAAIRLINESLLELIIFSIFTFLFGCYATIKIKKEIIKKLELKS